LEDDRVVIDEPRTASEEVRRKIRSIGQWSGFRTGREVRQHPSVTRLQIEYRDLGSLPAIERRPDVREGDATAVRGEGDRGRERVGPVQIQIDRWIAEIRPYAKALVTARRTEPTALGPVGADREDPVLLWGERTEREEWRRVVHLVDDRRSVRAYAQA